MSRVPFVDDTDLTLFEGDALRVLRELPSESVHMIATSPPYYALRDYGVDEQVGLEPTPEAYVERVVEIFREARRVLRSDGTLWLNLGASYAGNRSDTKGSSIPPGYKPKDMIPVPWLVGIALRQDGWWLRGDVIWEKKNALPESVRDRPGCSHEYVLLLSKSSRYFYDPDAIREPAEWARWGAQTVPKHEGTATKSGWMKPQTKAELKRKVSVHLSGNPGEGEAETPGSRNARSVWSIATKSYTDAHFAVMPEELARRCVLAGTSERGCCPSCGAGWEREVTRESTQTASSWRGSDRANGAVSGGGHEGRTGGWYPSGEQTGWRPTCECFGWLYRWTEISNEGANVHHAVYVWPDPAEEARVSALLTPAVCLDPFAGAGTTLAVARTLGRHSVGIELNPAYAAMIAERTKQLSLLAGA